MKGKASTRKPGRRLENPSRLFLFCEDKAYTLMWIEMIALSMWTIACCYLLFIVGFYQDHKTEQFVARMWGYQLGNNKEMMLEICSATGVVASLDKSLSLALFYLLNNGLYEKLVQMCSVGGIDGRLRQLEALFSFVKGIDGRLNTPKAAMDGQLNALRVTVEGINGRLKKIEMIEECRGGRARLPNDQRRECEGAPAAATAAMSTSTGGNSGRRQIIDSPSFNPSVATATGVRKQTTHAGQPPAYASEKPEALHVNKDNADVGSTNPTSNTSAAAAGEIEVNMAEPKNSAIDTVGPVYHLPITRSMSKLHLVTVFKSPEAEAPAPAERPRPRPYRCKLCPKRRHSPIPTFPNAEKLKEHYTTRHRHPMARICREGASASDSSITGASVEGVRRSPRGITVKQKQGKNAVPAEEVKKDKDTPKQQQRKKESDAAAAGTGPAKHKSSKSQTPNPKPSPSATTTTATDRSRRGAPGRPPRSGRSCPPPQPCDCEPKITAFNVNVKVKRQRFSSPSPLPSTSTSKKVRLGVDDGHQDAVSLRLRTCPECLLVLATPYHMHRHMQSRPSAASFVRKSLAARINSKNISNGLTGKCFFKPSILKFRAVTT